MTDKMNDFLCETYREYCCLNQLECISADELVSSLSKDHECYETINSYSQLWTELFHVGGSIEKAKEIFCKIYKVLPVERSEIMDAYYHHVGRAFNSYNHKAIYDDIVASAFAFLMDDEQDGNEFYYEDCGDDRQPFEILCNLEGIGMTEKMHDPSCIEMLSNGWTVEKLLPEENSILVCEQRLHEIEAFKAEIEIYKADIESLKKRINVFDSSKEYAKLHFETLAFMLDSFEVESKKNNGAVCINTIQRGQLKEILDWLDNLAYIEGFSNRTKFLVNQNDYYFAVECDVDIVKANCIQFPTRMQMYKYLAMKNDLSIDEVFGLEIFINKDKYVFDDRGCQSADTIDGSVEEYLKYFEL